MENFKSLGLHPDILASLEAMSFTAPTPIQQKTIPPALEGMDVLGCAQTGTGKTAAYGIPAISHLINSPDQLVLVLTPTRELAAQVHDSIRQMLGDESEINSSLLIGGDSMAGQIRQLSRRPRLIVGTPGRVNDHIERGTLKLANAGFLILDETDRMLDMGFSIQIEQIAKYLPKERQTLMFSATMAPGVARVAQNYLKNPVRISIGSTSTPVEKIKQETLQTTEAEKYELLLKQLDLFQGTCVVFVKTKIGADKLAMRLYKSNHRVVAIHGGLQQRARDRAIFDFRNSKHRILVATDVAARGLDIPHIECVINYDLPQCPEDYIHRIGRTGRAGAEGKAVNLLTSQDQIKWRSICRLINPNEKPPSITGIGTRNDPRIRQHRSRFQQQRRNNYARR
jgi:ATP-dependent RNA helicase DeaD